MKNCIIVLMALSSLSVLAVLPHEDTDQSRIIERERVTKVLNDKHYELTDPDCLYSPLESRRVKVLVAQGYFINQINWKNRFGLQFEAVVSGMTNQGDETTFYSVKCPLKRTSKPGEQK